MASRKKKDPAALRTLSLFSGKTPLEEAEHDLEVAADAAEQVARDKNPLDIAEHAEETAVRWLGLDVFHKGDDIKLAIHAKGHGVIMIIRTTEAGAVYNSSTIKLSKAQVEKLKQLARDI